MSCESDVGDGAAPGLNMLSAARWLPELTVDHLPLGNLTRERGGQRIELHEIVAAAERLQANGFEQPILIRKDGLILDGELEYEAARWLDLVDVPCISLDHLRPVEVEAFRLAVEQAGGWDLTRIGDEFARLLSNGLTFNDLGFDASANGEIDDAR